MIPTGTAERRFLGSRAIPSRPSAGTLAAGAVLSLVVALLGGAWASEPIGASPSPAPETMGRLYVYRLGSDAQVTATIRLDTTPVGRLPPNSLFRWDLAPGSYQILARSPTNIAKKTVDVTSGTSVYVQQSFEIDFRSFRRVRLRVRDEAHGEKAVRGLALVRAAAVRQGSSEPPMPVEEPAP